MFNIGDAVKLNNKARKLPPFRNAPEEYFQKVFTVSRCPQHNSPLDGCYQIQSDCGLGLIVLPEEEDCLDLVNVEPELQPFLNKNYAYQSYESTFGNVAWSITNESAAPPPTKVDYFKFDSYWDKFDAAFKTKAKVPTVKRSHPRTKIFSDQVESI